MLKKALITSIIILLLLSLPQLFHQNKEKSISIGTPEKGQLKNAWEMPFWGKNFRYFSLLSYFPLGNAYTHSAVYKTVLDAYKTCEKTCEGISFQLMECGRKKGGKTLFHRTHQNGMSVDFMVPKKTANAPSRILDQVGLLHYLLAFTDNGQSTFSSKIVIDFESIGKHLLALDDAAKKNGLKIKKVILKIELKDDLFKTPSGKKLRARDIYFAQSLSKRVNDLHDDHYHVDFR